MCVHRLAITASSVHSPQQGGTLTHRTSHGSNPTTRLKRFHKKDDPPCIANFVESQQWLSADLHQALQRSGACVPRQHQRLQTGQPRSAERSLLVRVFVATGQLGITRSDGNSIFAVLPDLKYASSHEWAKADGEVATVGISDHAQVWSLTNAYFIPLYSS